ncbi:NnrU family protein [Cognatishimia sp. WU-CL00825]|uniref:NnrU family protein n=1 Tax=Cognatishimia sp. WU-CL00825 TaxID=3127658 RepID=UPI00310B0CF7
MTLLVIGLIIWFAAHLFKRVMPDARARLGDKGKGLIALLLLLSVVLMVLGYRAAEYTHLWDTPAWGKPVNNVLVLFALYFTSPGPKKGAIFYGLRHPMLIGVALWAIAHILVNGDIASAVLFGGLWVWTLIEIRVINRAEPAWEPNPKGTIAKDAMFLAISVLLLGVIGAIHMLFGLNAFGG